MSENTLKLLQQAEHLMEIERWQEAIPLLVKILAENPQNFRANGLLSQCFYELKEFDKALKYAEKAISVAPGAEWGHRLRSLIMMELGEKKEAVKAAEEAIRLAPDELSAMQTLVFAYLDNNQIRKAITIAEKMRENFPESEETYFTLGNVCLQSGNPKDAEMYFRESLRLNPLNSNARNNLGVAILRQGSQNSLSIIQNNNGEDAVAHFTEAAKLEPNNEFALENLKNQFTYSPYIFAQISLIPFFLLCFLVVPIGAIISIIISLCTLFGLFWNISKQRKNLSPEMKSFLKANKKTFKDYFAEFKLIATKIFQKTAHPHLLAVFAVFLSFFGLLNKQGGSIFRLIAVLMIIGSGVWLTSKLNQD